MKDKKETSRTYEMRQSPLCLLGQWHNVFTAGQPIKPITRFLISSVLFLCVTLFSASITVHAQTTPTQFTLIKNVLIDSADNFTFTTTFPSTTYTATGQLGGGIDGTVNNNDQFSYPQGIDVAADGTIYIADTFNHRIQIFDGMGVYSRTIGTAVQGSGNDQLYYPDDVAVAADGTLYVADSNNHRIQIFDGMGVYSRTIGTNIKGNGDDQFDMPYSVDVAADGTVYVADTFNDRIQIFDGTGVYSDTISIIGEYGGFFRPNDVAIAADGTIYIADTNNNRIQIFDGTTYGRSIGTVSEFTELSDVSDGFNFPSGVAVAADGTLYIADTSNDRIQIFDNTDTYSTTLGTGFGNGDTQLSSPFGIAVAADGTVYVADTYNHRISIWSFLPITTTLDDPAVDDGDSISNTFTTSRFAAGTYTITEQISGDWAIDSVVCTSNVNGDLGRTVSPTRTVTFAEGEQIICTYNNVIRPDVTVLQSMPATVLPGEVVTYTAEFANLRGTAARPITLTATIPPELLVTNIANSANSDVTLTPITTSNPYAWSVETMFAEGDSGVVTITATVDPNITTETVITSTATITTANDISDSNNRDNAVTTILIPDVVVTKTAGVDTANIGDTVTYAYVIHNTGGTPLDIEAADDVLGMLSGFTTPLMPGDDTIAFATHVVTNDDLPAITNTVKVTGTTVIGTIVTDEDTASVVITNTTPVTETVIVTDTVDITNTILVTETVLVTHTVVVTDAVNVTNTVLVTETVVVTNTIDVTNTVLVTETVIVTNTIDVTNTIPVTETVVITNTIDVTNTIPVTETVVITNMIDMTNTIPVTETIVVTNTIQVTETVVITNTVDVTNTIPMTETVVVTNTIDVTTTIQVTETVVVTNTIDVTNTIPVTETVVVTNTIDVTNTIPVTETVVVTNTVDVTNTIPVTETVVVTNTVDVTTTIPVTETVVVTNTVDVTNTITVTETVVVTNMIDVTTTIPVTETVVVTNTVDVTNTITVTETVVVTNMIDVTTTIPVTETVVVTNTVDVTNTITVTETVVVTNTVNVTNTIPVTETVIMTTTIPVTETISVTETVIVTDTVIITETVPTDSTDVIVVSADGGIDNIMLNWKVISTLTGTFHHFDLFVSADGESRTVVASTTENNYADNDELVRGGEYCYSVEAVDMNGRVIGRSNINCALFGELQLVVPDQVLPPNGRDVPVAIRVVNGNGLCPVAMDIYLEYDPAIVVATGVKNTPYTAQNQMVGNVSQLGVVNIASIATSSTCEALSGSGALFEVLFDVVGVEQSVSPLTFVRALSATVIYDNDDLSTPVSLHLNEGSLWIADAYTRGDVDGNGTINAVDALLVLQIATGEYIPTIQQEAACDVNVDEQCDAADASLILCHPVIGSWGTCNEARSIARSGKQQNTTSVELADINRGSIPVSFVASEGGVAGGSLTFAYDPATMTVLGISTEGTLLDGVMNISDGEAGLLQVAFARNTTIGKSGTLFYIDTDATMNDSSLQLVGVQFNNTSGLDWENNLDNTIMVKMPDRTPTAILSQPLTTSTTTLSILGLVSVLTAVIGIVGWHGSFRV